MKIGIELIGADRILQAMILFGACFGVLFVACLWYIRSVRNDLLARLQKATRPRMRFFRIPATIRDRVRRIETAADSQIQEGAP